MPKLTCILTLTAVLQLYCAAKLLEHLAEVPMHLNRSDPRHAREYTPREIRQLFEDAGFHVDHLETGVYRFTEKCEHDWVLPILKERGLPADLRGDVIHIVGSKAAPVRERYPAWLYV